MRSAFSHAFFLALGLFLGMLLFAYATPTTQANCINGSVTPVLTPGNAEQEILSALGSAQSSIDLILYQFSYSPLKEALVNAVRKGVRVRLILDSTVDGNLETASFLSGKGVEVEWGSSDYAHTHAKLAVIDAKKVLVGSTNWSRHAMQLNRETAVLIDDARTAQTFGEVFENDWAKAGGYKG